MTQDDDAILLQGFVSPCLVRLPVWIIATLTGAWFIGSGTLQFSRMVVERGWDRSAMAWTIALPFMIPIWIFEAGCVVLPVALLYEGIAWAISRRKTS
jgi:hypothetical protein